MPQVIEGNDGDFEPPSTATVLSFHGGGFLGYFSALVAEMLTARKAELGDPRPLGTSFDLIAGTSIGAILAAAVACDIEPARIVKLMESHGEKIFPRRWYLHTKPGIFCARFSAEPLRSLIEKVLEDRTLGDLDRALVIPTISETAGRPVIFRSHDPDQADFRLVDVVMASAAAPSFFPLHRINQERFTDGGLIANGPELLACADLAAKFDIPIGCHQIISIGTTRSSPQSPVAIEKPRDWGLFAWIFRHSRLQPLLLGTQIDLHVEILAAFRPRAFLHLDMELSSEEASRVDMVRADQHAKRTLKQVAARLTQKLKPCLSG